MKTAGIVAEYNPFHNGHKYHIEKTREITGAECMVAVMSGNFVQRGEPAIFSKHERAKAAVYEGVDLVIELPAYFSLKSAEGFSDGAISLLNAIGCDYISFGAETDNLEDIKSLACCFLNESDAFKEQIKCNLKLGKSFALSREKAAVKVFNCNPETLKTPNNILGIEYVKSIIKHDYKCQPIIVKRFGNDHDSETTKGTFSSASHIRKLILSGKEYAKYSNFKSNESPVSINDFEKLILYSIKTFDFSNVPDISDGLYQRINASKANNIDDFLKEVKTKRHALSRIKRVIMNILIRNNLDFNLEPSYIRVLAANKKGREKLSQLKDNCKLPVIIKPSSYNELNDIWKLEKQATNIRNIITNGVSEEKISPIIIND